MRKVTMLVVLAWGVAAYSHLPGDSLGGLWQILEEVPFPRTTIKKPELVCENSNDTIAVNFSSNTLWLTDRWYPNHGFAFSKVRKSPGRCLSCYTVVAERREFQITLHIRPQGLSSVASAILTNSLDRKSARSLNNLVCKIIK